MGPGHLRHARLHDDADRHHPPGERTRSREQVKNAPRLTAEWIVEAPSEACGKATCPVLALAKFPRIVFTGGLAVIAGRLGSIGDRHWSRDEITDISNSGTHRTTVSGLAAKGQSFTVTWRHT